MISLFYDLYFKEIIDNLIFIKEKNFLLNFMIVLLSLVWIII